jgi:hypothetical protein
MAQRYWLGPARATPGLGLLSICAMPESLLRKPWRFVGVVTVGFVSRYDLKIMPNDKNVSYTRGVFRVLIRTVIWSIAAHERTRRRHCV